MQSAIKNPEKLKMAIEDFVAFVDFKDHGRQFSFVDESSFLGSKDGEGYKMKAALRARDELQCEKWDESWINSGKILERCKRAVGLNVNLIYWTYKKEFDDMLSPQNENFNPEAERTLYEIYKSRPGDEEKTAFENVKKIFGGSYRLIAYLFFVKAPSRFVPVSPEHFDENVFPYLSTVYGLEVNYEKLSGKCSWENYMGFIKIVKEVQEILQEKLPELVTIKSVRLIDAHSFLWLIGWEKFKEWNKKHK